MQDLCLTTHLLLKKEHCGRPSQYPPASRNSECKVGIVSLLQCVSKHSFHAIGCVLGDRGAAALAAAVTLNSKLQGWELPGIAPLQLFNAPFNRP